MRISRLFVEAALAEGELIRLDEDRAHYLRTVLRLKRGFELIIFNGETNADFAARVEISSRDEVWLKVGEAVVRDRESPLQIELGIGISRGERMDFAIQKSVELGVARVVPLFTEHCVVRLEGEKAETRRTHWRKIARAACEQSGRNRVPDIARPQPLAEWVENQTGPRLFFDPQGQVGLRELAPPPGQRISLLSGPEGGFSDPERTLALARGFTPVRLGPRILRTETAALAAIASLQTLWGDG
jgi:16S rRNA (uracil1498-N3)-methyltransferase